VLAGRRSVTEGVHTAAAIVRLAARLGVDAPVSAAVDAVVSRSADIDQTVTALLDRPLRREGA
jgi:glycerol-3-phosphate dehydrogenase (NAD(P)+)